MTVSDFQNDTNTAAKLSADSVQIEQPDGTTLIDVPAPAVEPESKPQLSESDALKNARMMMEIRESLQATGIAFWVDGQPQGYQQYLYPGDEKERLAKAWAPIIQQQNLHVSPWLHIATTEIMCTGPLVALAINNRKYRKQLEVAMQENAALKSKLNDTQKLSPRYTEPSQNRWLVNDNGFFVRTEKGQYLAKEKQKQKPDFSIEQTLPLLIQHNGEERVKQIYGDI